MVSTFRRVRLGSVPDGSGTSIQPTWLKHQPSSAEGKDKRRKENA
jgi:hypothetical protein